MIDVSNPERPRLLGELRATQNEQRACADGPRTSGYSYSSHNPTVAGGFALVSWHGAGLVAASLSGERLTRDATFVPRALARVATEDPRLTAGPVRVAMWSTPVVAGGLIYVVDVRNGLYVLRYDGPRADALAMVRFAEGNSNVTG